jgi:hypothetical protein
LEGIESIRGLVLSGDKIHVLVEDPQEGERVIWEVMKREGIQVLGLMSVRPSLEDAFVSFVRQKREETMQI